MVRPRLRAEGVSLRLMDVMAPTDFQDGEETIVGSVTDRRVLTDAMHGVDTVVHLAGIAAEAAWDDILDANVTGTQSVLQSAVDAGVTRLVLASRITRPDSGRDRRPQSGDFPPTSRPDPTPSTAGARPPGKPWPALPRQIRHRRGRAPDRIEFRRATGCACIVDVVVAAGHR